MRTGLGLAAERSGELPAAIANYRAALRANPDSVEAANNLAWILATAPDPALRAPGEAIELAQRAARAGANPTVLDTLAAAYASARRYSEAVETEERALAALGSGPNPLRAELERRLVQYRASLRSR